jgi:hypothetical protein
MQNRKHVFTAAATLPLILSLAAPAHAFNIGDFFKGVGNVLTGGLLGLAEGAAKVAKTGKVSPGDILNFATGGAAGAIKDAVGTAHKTHGLVRSAVSGIANSVRDIVKRMGISLPKLPGLGGLMGGRGKGGPLGMLGAFGKTFTSGLSNVFAGGIRKLGLRPGRGLFKTGFGLVRKALERAKHAALAFGRKHGLRLPNLGGLTSFFSSRLRSAFDLGRKVALKKVARVPGQFVKLIRAGSVTKAVSGFAKKLPKRIFRKKSK